MAAVKERAISDDAETSRIDSPISGFQPSKAADKQRDTVNEEPPRRPLILSVFLFIVDLLLFLPRIVARVILYEAGAIAARFKKPPPLREVLPNPAAQIPHRDPALSSEEITELVTHELFRVPSRYLAGVARIASVLRDIPLEDKDGRFDVFVLLCLSRLPTDRGKAAPIAWLRTKLPEVERRVLNSSLKRLEKHDWITLSDPGTDDPLFVKDGLTIVPRGRLTHVCPLRRF